MVKRDIGRLAVYPIDKEVEMLALKQFSDLYLKKTSDIVYITKDGKLYGIVCMEEALSSCTQNGFVYINKTFTMMREGNVIEAHEIFKSRGKITKIPIVNEHDELVGDYSRWDDLRYVEQNHFLFMKEKTVKKILEPYESVYVIEPVEKRHPQYRNFIDYLECFKINYTILDKEQFAQILSERAICIFMNEDERRGVQCLYGLKSSANDSIRENVFNMLEASECNVRMATYRILLMQIKEENELEQLKINRESDMPYSKIDNKATVLMTELQQRGVQCFCLYEYENGLEEYRKKFMAGVSERLTKSPLDTTERMWTDDKMLEEFYDDLYQREDYRKGTVSKELSNAGRNFECGKDITERYFNSKDGKRITYFQPKEYIGTIYLLGPCVILGILAEDQYTIESYLQKKMLENRYWYRVVNCGAMSRPDGCMDSRLEEIGRYSKNDVVIFLSRIGGAAGIKGASIENIFNKYQIPNQWVTDAYIHCNHKVNQIIAESMFDMMQGYLKKNVLDDDSQKVEVDLHAAIKDYIRKKYLDLYFLDFKGENYTSVGAIIMNCNPFSLGHRYLIEKAKQKVDFLIIFVVEEDKSLFPFEERMDMVRKGTDDMDHVMVVPSGEFILSQNNFFEYFSKQEDAVTAINAKYDINVFADYIAKPLCITYRFAGEEPEDRVTAIYNETMSAVLPQKGITFVEIPRLKVDGAIVSASAVRTYLRHGEYSKAFKLLPETTRKYLKEQM